MKFSCIMTVYNEGPILRQSVQSVLSQTYENLELVIVDDGSGPDTQAILREFDDPRLVVIPQANDGLSSARNRGLQHATGDYICFLDADDVRAPWAFARVAEVIAETQAELIMVRGVFAGTATGLEPFYDSDAFDRYAALAASGDLDLAQRKAWATAFEPQSANKFLSRALLERGKLRFPNDHFFEDILFHAMAIAHARSVEVINEPNYTYFHRMLYRQTTGSNGMIRFDIIGVARMTLQLFQAHSDFHNQAQRAALMLGVLRLLRWCEEQSATYHVEGYRVALGQLMVGLDPEYLVIPVETPSSRNDRDVLIQYAKEVLL